MAIEYIPFPDYEHYFDSRETAEANVALESNIIENLRLNFMAGQIEIQGNEVVIRAGFRWEQLGLLFINSEDVRLSLNVSIPDVSPIGVPYTDVDINLRANILLFARFSTNLIRQGEDCFYFAGGMHTATYSTRGFYKEQDRCIGLVEMQQQGMIFVPFFSFEQIRNEKSITNCLIPSIWRSEMTNPPSIKIPGIYIEVVYNGINSSGVQVGGSGSDGAAGNIKSEGGKKNGGDGGAGGYNTRGSSAQATHRRFFIVSSIPDKKEQRVYFSSYSVENRELIYPPLPVNSPVPQGIGGNSRVYSNGLIGGDGGRGGYSSLTQDGGYILPFPSTYYQGNPPVYTSIDGCLGASGGGGGGGHVSIRVGERGGKSGPGYAPGQPGALATDWAFGAVGGYGQKGVSVPPKAKAIPNMYEFFGLLVYIE